MTKDIKLDEYEQDLEDNLEKCLPIPNVEAEIALIMEAAAQHVRNRKDLSMQVQRTDAEARGA